MLEQLQRSVAAGNQSDALKFDLLNYAEFPSLYDPAQMGVIVSRSIAELDLTMKHRELLTSVLEYGRKVGPASEVGQSIGHCLLKAKLRRSDLDTVAAVYPQVASAARQRMFVKAQLAVKGVDRIASDGLTQAVASKIKGITFEDGRP